MSLISVLGYASLGPSCYLSAGAAAAAYADIVAAGAISEAASDAAVLATWTDATA
jgi:hypothetical protein